jgi:hypothetical protein
LEGLIVCAFFLWQPALGMNIMQTNVPELLEFAQASRCELLHLFSQSGDAAHLSADYRTGRF